MEEGGGGVFMLTFLGVLCWVSCAVDWLCQFEYFT